MINMINNSINNILGTNSRAREAALNTAYHTMAAAGHDVAILNEKYLVVDNNKIKFVSKAGKLTAQQW